MRKSTVQFAAVAAGFVLFVAASAQAQTATIQAGQATGNPGGTTTFDVTLDNGGLAVVGTQNDIGFQPQTAIPAGANNRPMCTANAAIMREASQFAFQPAGCTVGTTCTGIRAIILSFSNLDPIPNGSVLYTCTVNIASDAAVDNYALAVTGASSSDAAGTSLATTGANGQITVEEGGGPTPTPTTGPTAPVNIVIGSANGSAGDTVPFDVTLESTADAVGTQNDIAFDANAAIPVGTNNRPNCAVNPAIMREASQFAFQPAGCTPGTSCTGIRAIILSFSNLDPIPTGSVLYTCNVKIADNAADGSYPLTCSGASSSDAAGGSIETSCQNGAITVGVAGQSTLASAIGPEDTTIPLVDASGFPDSGTVQIEDELISYTGKDGNNLTGATRGAGGTTAAAHAAGTPVTLQQVVATPTSTGGQPTATSTPQVTSTATVGTPAGTATRTAVRTPTSGFVILDDDGCAVVSPVDGQAAWLLLFPAAMLIWLRRRAR